MEATVEQWKSLAIKSLEVLREQFTPVKGLVYRGAADFVLQHGIWYAPDLPLKYPLMPPKQCFANAINCAAAHPELEYVEGFAVAYYPGASPALLHHGWNLKEGVVVDPTWPGHWVHPEALTPLIYCGVTFRLERADEASWDGDACVLDDKHRGYPIFQQPWKGEPDMEWAWSERLSMVRNHDLEAGRRWFEANKHEMNAPKKLAQAIELGSGLRIDKALDKALDKS